MEPMGSGKGAQDIDMHGLEATELRLGLPGTTSTPTSQSALKRMRTLEEDDEQPTAELPTESTSRRAAPPTKSQVVGWPPVQSFRMKNNQADQKRQKANTKLAEEEEVAVSSSTSLAQAFGFLVKVSMDGAPYLRKVDLGAYKGYKDLRLAIDNMFRCYSLQSPENIMTYEDKDGDWMLVGDVPWEMFTSSCKRLRIMKESTNNMVR